MSMTQISSQRLGGDPQCSECGAGQTISFNWRYAEATSRPEMRRDLSVFVNPRPLRYGTLYTCRSCGQAWYLCGDPPFMHFVAKERLPLVEEWDRTPIKLSPRQLYALEGIGRTPPDLYGNGIQFHETPCSVVTREGECINLAVISRQRHAPIEEWRQCRLASEIVEIHPSPHALSLAVRLETTQAEEFRMGFAPTVVVLPSGEELALNWAQHFLVWDQCDASKVVLSSNHFDFRNPAKIYNGTQGVVYFVADEDSG